MRRQLSSIVLSSGFLIGLVLIVDARHGLKPLDLDLLDAFMPSGRDVLVLATKIDKLNVANGRDAIASIRASVRDRYGEVGGHVAVVGFSATTRRGFVEADEILRGWLA